MLENAYQLSRSQVLHDLRVSGEQGLSLQHVKQRRERFGNNDLPRDSRRHVLGQFFERFRDVLVWVLLGAALFSIFLGRWGDASIILIALLLDALLSFAQVWRTERTLSKIRQFVQPYATVIRDGRVRQIPAPELVVGDVIEVRAGEQIPADARLLTANGLRIQEASLTGESADVAKSVTPLKGRVPLSGRRNMLYMSTVVVNGFAKAVVVATGTRTEIGKIAQVLKAETSPPSPLRRKLQEAGVMIGVGILASIGILMMIGLARGQDLLSTLLTAVTLIVSAIPEDLTMILTIALTIGVARILRRKGAVRQLTAGETLGAATIICTDKTGTLTEGIMQAEFLDFLQGTIIRHGSSTQVPPSSLRYLALVGLAVASDARRVLAETGSVSYIGTATERAALAFVESAGLSQDNLRRDWQERSTISFSPEWKYRAALHDHPTQPTRYLFAVGAPDILLHRSSQVLNAHDEPMAITAEKRYELVQQLKKHAAQGQRMVGVAVRRNLSLDRIQHDDVADLIFLGVLGINDPVRADVPRVIQQTLAAGIMVKLVTGDHPDTARAIAQKVGIATSEVITSEDMEQISDDELRSIVQTTTVFARITPLDKQRIVRALQAQGHVVAMTGDGINDAVALKGADIGVAMGSGKDIAKQAADLVLLDDSFTTIVAAIREGRVLRDNVRKVISFLLATNSTEVAIFFVSVLTGTPLPLLPAQILWINLVTDGTSDIALSLEPAERNVMKRRPEDPDASLIDRSLVAHIIFTGLVMTIGAVGLFWYVLQVDSRDLVYARTMVFTFLSLASLLSVWSFRSLTESIIRRGLFANIWVPVSLAVSLGLQLLALYFPPLQRFFTTVPITLQDWSIIAIVAFATLLIIDTRKIVLPRLWSRRILSDGLEKQPLAPT